MSNDNIEIWIADFCSGKIDKKDFKELQKWIESSPENRDEFERMLRTHNSSREIMFMSRVDIDAARQRLMQRIVSNKRRWIHKLPYVAASLLLIALTTLWFFRNHEEKDSQLQTVLIEPGKRRATLELATGGLFHMNNDLIFDNINTINSTIYCDSSTIFPRNDSLTPINSYHTITVPRGGEFHVTLSDSSKIWLNSESMIRIPIDFNSDKREIFMRGEVYLEITHDPEHPFTVSTDNVKIDVLGTIFNVTSYPEDNRTVTTLLSGSVKVNAGDSEITLSPDEQAIWSSESKKLTVIPIADASYYTSWVKGVFEFENMPLRDIMWYVARWYDIDYSFDQPDIGDWKFTGGILRYLPLEEFFKTVEQTTDIKFELFNSKINISRK